MTTPQSKAIHGEPLRRLYVDRRSQEDVAFRKRVWEVLCELVFQRYVSKTDTVVDLGAGWCEFINSIECGERIAVDLNPDMPLHAGKARPIVTPCYDLSPIASNSIDVVFTSNMFEHLADKETVLQTMKEALRVLKPDATLIVVMPNIRYLSKRYWDYFDHNTPMSHSSLAEGLRLAGFDVERVVPRFVPYLVKSRFIPKTTLMLRTYLHMRFLWPLFGRQMMAVARKPHGIEVVDAHPGA